ncbi:hypothetical protein TNCV_3824951 [Trichonephila clavipes]|nr:hypothetical protein TNCV_3824951 [Trichonephila clavipes]
MATAGSSFTPTQLGHEDNLELVCRWPSVPKVAGSTPAKFVSFPDAENRQRPCRMIIRHEKYPLRARWAWMVSTKLNFSAKQISYMQTPGAFLWGRNWASKLYVVIGMA